jgi:hypothetical protein
MAKTTEEVLLRLRDVGGALSNDKMQLTSHG